MSRISVLVADDNRPIRHLLTSALTEHFRVLPPVADGRALVESALRHRPDVIVSDVSMPGLDGIAAMHALKSLGCAVPIVMVSAEDDIGPRCLEAGAAAFVCKEDLGTQLVPAVLQALASYIVHNAARDWPHRDLDRLSERPVPAATPVKAPETPSGSHSSRIAR